METTTPYGIHVRSPDAFARAVERVTAELKNEGFGIITQIDLRAALKDKIGVEFRPYVILGACNPRFAHEAIQVEPDLGLLLPCNVVVEEQPDGGVVLGAVRPTALLERLAQRPDLAKLARDVEERLERALGRASSQIV